MFKKIKSVFEIITQVIAVYSFIVTLVELKEEGKGEEKKKQAIDWLRETGSKLVEEGKIPEWVYSIFFDSVILGWAIDVLVSLANRLGFFGEEE